MTGAPDDLMDREPLDLPHPPDLRPALHVEHRLPPRRSHDQTRLGVTPDTTDTRSTRVRFQPAQAGDYSGGAYILAGWKSRNRRRGVAATRGYLGGWRGAFRGGGPMVSLTPGASGVERCLLGVVP